MSEDETFESLPLNARGHSFSLRGNPEAVRVWTSSVGIRRVHDLRLFNCRFCDFYPSFELTDTATAREECPHPDGLTTVTRVNFPSGKIIVSDDLRTAYDWDTYEQGFASYNSSLGVHQVIKHMASQGCAFGYVGNSSPDVFRTGDGTYTIASIWTNDDDEIPAPEGWTHVASICTDLWAYSIADFRDWSAKSAMWAESGKDEAEREKRSQRVKDRLGYSTVMDIEPGTYRFTCRSAEKDFDTHANGAVFATFERIGD